MSDIAVNILPVRLTPNHQYIRCTVKPSPGGTVYNTSLQLAPLQLRAATHNYDSPPWRHASAGPMDKQVHEGFPSPISRRHLDPALKAALNTHCEILFQDFELVMPDGSIRGLRGTEFDILSCLFDTTVSCTQGLLYIVIRVGKLPLKPWPYALVGMPLHITDSGERPEAYAGISGAGVIMFCMFAGNVQLNLEPILRGFYEYFVLVHAMSPLSKLEIRWYGKFFIVVVPADLNIAANRRTLPQRLAMQDCWFINATITTKHGEGVNGERCLMRAAWKWPTAED